MCAGPLLASILGQHPGVSMHLGVIFVFPVMCLTTRDLGELIPRNTIRGTSFVRTHEQRKIELRGTLVSSKEGFRLAFSHRVTALHHRSAIR